MLAHLPPVPLPLMSSSSALALCFSLSGLIPKMRCSRFSSETHLVSLALGEGREVLVSPARGQKSSLGLIAQQTAAGAERNANVALLERKAKKGQGREAFCCCLAPAAVGEDRWQCRGGSLAPQPCS